MLKIVAEKVGLERHYSSLENRIDKAAVIDYSVRTYAIMFFAYSFVGWVWEVILFLAVEQQFVNTGLLHGPWLPIYGVGGVISLELFKNIRNNPRKTFISIMIAAGIMEYATHAATEKIFGVTWWDYSDYLLNINGRICLEGLVIFGILGCISIYMIAPKVNEIVLKMDVRWQNLAIMILSAIFLADMLFSFMSPNLNNIY